MSKAIGGEARQRAGGDGAVGFASVLLIRKGVRDERGSERSFC